MYLWNTTPMLELHPARKDRTMGTLNPIAVVDGGLGNSTFVETGTGLAAAR
jgi:hypothetical protein